MAVAYDTTGAGYVNVNFGSAATIAHTAASGADVFLFISADRASTMSSVTYNGNAMTSLGSISYNNNNGNGVVYLYRAAGAGTGTSKNASFTPQTSYLVAQTVSYTGVTSVGTATTNYGSSTSPTSGSITLTSGQMALCGLAAGQTGAMTSLSGGTNRYNQGEGTGGTSLDVSDATSTATFSATSTNVPWGTIYVVLKSSVTASGALTGTGALSATDSADTSGSPYPVTVR